MFKTLARLRDCNERSSMLTEFKHKSDLPKLILNLIQLAGSENSSLGSVGQVVKFFAKNRETYKLFLSYDIFNSIFENSNNHNFQLASEFQTILEALMLSEDLKIRSKVSDYVYTLYQYIFHWIKQSTCICSQRNLLNLLYRAMQDPCYLQFRVYFINSKEQLKDLMVGLTSPHESIRFENYLLLSLYLTRFEHIENEAVKRLIRNNKSNLLMALMHVHPEKFDQQCDSGVCIDQLEQILKQISAGI